MKYLFALLLTIILTGCTATTEDTIKIGGLHHLSGAGVQFGTDEMRGAQLAIEEINAAGGVNGKTLEYIVEDTQTDPAAALSGYRKLVDVDGVNYLVGPPWGPFALLIIPHLQADGVIEIAPTVGEEYDEYKDPHFFRVWPADKYETVPLIEHMERSGVQRIAVITSAESFGASMRAGFLEMLNGSSVEVAHDVTVNVGESDYRSTLLKVRDADALYVVTAGYAEVATIARQAKELGFTGPVYTFSGIDQNEEYRSLCSSGCAPVVIPITAESGAMRTFNEKFRERYGEYPSTPAAATSYDGTRMLAIALENGKDAESVMEGLHAIRDFGGVSGMQRFDGYGWPVVDRSYELHTLEDGEYVLLSPR